MESGKWDGQEDGQSQRKAWEWTGLGELVATCILLMVCLGAAMGMLLRVVNPRRKARALGQAVGHAVHKAARDAQEAAQEALAPPATRNDDDVKLSV